jgi:hypothetical protein
MKNWPYAIAHLYVTQGAHPYPWLPAQEVQKSGSFGAGNGENLLLQSEVCRHVLALMGAPTRRLWHVQLLLR